MRLTAHTPAKVNLTLLVGPRRADGYHELFSVFAPIDLCDELEFDLAVAPAPAPGSDGDLSGPAEGAAPPGRDGGVADAGGVAVSCPGIDAADNLVARALRALAEAAGRGIVGEVKVRKAIPVGAGLGGGSSDAALALRAGAELLAREAGIDVAAAQLGRIAAALGADVPFFLAEGPAMARGIGERLEPTTLPPLHLVLVPPTEPLSTPLVYRTFDEVAAPETRDGFDERTGAAEGAWREMASAWVVGGRSGPRWAESVATLLENDLERASFVLRPELVEVKQAVREAGAAGALMSGSGPTMFGVCVSARAAEEAARRLGARGFAARATVTLTGAADCLG